MKVGRKTFEWSACRKCGYSGRSETFEKVLHYYVPYRCPECGSWGNNLSDEYFDETQRKLKKARRGKRRLVYPWGVMEVDR